MEIYLIRHTTPKVEKGICYGQSDLALAPTYSAELAKVEASLPRAFDAVYSSPLHRCRQLAESLFQKRVTFDPRLMEIDFGEWEMKPWSRIPRDALDTWMGDFVNERPPGGESMQELQHRVVSWWQEVEEQSAVGKVAVVTHLGVIRTLAAWLRKMPLENTIADVHVGYGGVYRY